MTVAYDFAGMTSAQALDALVELEVTKWGEQERAAARRLHGSKSRGLLINSIVHHQCNGYGDAFDAAVKKIAKLQLTSDDKAELRKGG